MQRTPTISIPRASPQLLRIGAALGAPAPASAPMLSGGILLQTPQQSRKVAHKGPLDYPA